MGDTNYAHAASATTANARNAGNIKGLSITAIALSIVMILGSLLCCILLVITGTAFGDGAFHDYLAFEMSSELGHGHGYDSFDAYDTSLGILNFVISLFGLLLAWEIVGSIVTLVAGIVAMRNAGNIAKYGSVFSWSVAGAIASVLGGRLVTMALFIVIAVFANKDKNAAETAQFHAQGNPNFTQPGYVQASVSQNPFYTYTPTEAAPQPQQPSAPTSASQPQQPSATPYVNSAQAWATPPKVYPQPTPGYQQTYCQPMPTVEAMPAADATPANAAASAVEPASAIEPASAMDVAPAAEAGAAQPPAEDEIATEARPVTTRDEEVEGKQA